MGGHDVLAEMLRAVRLTGAVFMNARFTAPFGVISPKQYDERMPMARMTHISIFHLIASGGCTIELATGERSTISAGDILLVPFAAAHKFWNGENVEMALAADVIRPSPLKGMWCVNYGGGGEETRMVCGFLESSEFVASPVFRTLPPLHVDRMNDDKVSAVIASTVKEVLALADAAEPGTEFTLGRLMELLFVEVLRRYAARLPTNATGWFAALNDPIVGRALQFVHADPTCRWTVDRLAREFGLLAHRACRALQRDLGPGADRICHQLADAIGGRAHPQQRRQLRRDRRRCWLWLASRLQPRLQARDGDDARPIARGCRALGSGRQLTRPPL